jgi:hypothetical protein
VHTSGRFAVLTIEDPHTFEEWRSTVLAMVAETSASPQMCLLVDRRHSTPPSSEEVKQMIDFFEQNRSVLAGRSAAIVVVGDAGFGVARMIELRSRLRILHGGIRLLRMKSPFADVVRATRKMYDWPAAGA